MTVAEYQQAQNDIAEIKAQIAQLRDVVAKGVPAVREIYGADLPTQEPLPEAGASYPNVGALQFQQGKMMAGAELAKTAVTPFSSGLEAIRGNPEEQGTAENIVRGGAALLATAPAMLPLTIEQSVTGGVERGNPLAPATDMAQAIGQTFQRQVTGEAGGVTRGEAWSKTPVEEAFNLATPLLAGLGISKAMTPKIKSIKEARAAINDIGKPKVEPQNGLTEASPTKTETPKVAKPKSKELSQMTSDEFNSHLDALADERARLSSERPDAGAPPRGSLEEAISIAVSPAYSLENSIEAIKVAIANDRKDVAMAIIERKRRSAENAITEPGVSKTNPKYESIKQALDRSKKSEEQEVQQLKRLYELQSETIGKPKVDVPEVVQEPVRSEAPKVDLSSEKPQPTTAQEVVETAKPLINQEAPTAAPNVPQQQINQINVRSQWNFESTYNRLSGDGGSQRVGQVELQNSDNGLEAFHAVTGSKLGDISFDGSVIPTKEKFRSQLESVVDYYEKQSKLMDVASELSRPNVRAEGLTDIALLAESNPEALKYVDKPTRDLIAISEKFKPITKQPTTATEVVAKAKPNLVTGNVKALTPDELTAAQAKLREKFKPMDETIDNGAGKTSTEPTATVQDAAVRPAQSTQHPLQREASAYLENVDRIKKLEKKQKGAEYASDISWLGETDNILRREFNKSRQNGELFGDFLTRISGRNDLKPKATPFLADYPDLAAKYGKPTATAKAKEPWEVRPREWIKGVKAGDNEWSAMVDKHFSAIDEFNRDIDTPGTYAEKTMRGSHLAADPFQRKHPEHAYASVRSGLASDALIPRLSSHKAMVEQAIKDGKPVPPEVLADYPDLAAKYGKPTTAEAVVKKAGEKAQRKKGKVPTAQPVASAASEITTEAFKQGNRASFKRVMIGSIDDAIRDAKSIIDYGGENLSSLSKQEARNRYFEMSRDGRNVGGTMYKIGGSTPKITIHIPDDGDFTIYNTVEHLSELKKRVGLALGTKSKSVGEYTFNESYGSADPISIATGKKIFAGENPFLSKEQMAKYLGNKKDAPPPPTELHAGVNPFKIIDDYMTKRKLVNPLGTPEIVLRGKGIVQPLREAGDLMRNDLKVRGEKLRSMLEGVKRDSPEDYAVFGKLDDPNAVLPKREQEIRNYLDELLGEVNKHREARGQDPVKYRKGYITHLPTDAKMSEILDILESASADYGDTPMPKKFRFQFEKARKGDPDYKLSAIDALEVYTQAALKDIYIGDALAKAVPNVEALGGKPLLVKNSFTTPDGKTVNITEYRWTDSPIMTERGYAEAFIKGQMNVPTIGQRALKAMFDIRPNTSMKVAHATTGTFYRSLLGFAVDSGIKNLTQNINTLAEYGVLPSMKGFAKFVTPEGLKEAKAQHLLDDFNPMLLEGHDLPMKSKVGRAIGKGFAASLNAPMKVAEFINRGIAYHTAYDVNIKKGLPLEAAHDLAREGVRKTQFSYSKVDTSPALRGPFARLATQFLSYPIKQSELMYKWATMPGEQGKLARYFLYTGMAIMGAKYAGIDVSGVFFDPIRMVDPNSKEGMNLPWSDKRVKVDWSKLGQSGYTPRGLTPIVSIPKEFITSQTSDDDYVKKQGLVRGITNVLPGGRYGKKVYDVVTESDEVGSRGRKIRENTDRDKVLKLLGAKSTDREAESSRREKTAEVEKKYYATRQKLIDLKISGNEDEFIKLRDEFRDKYPFLYGRLMKGFGDAVKEERKKKGMTTDERFFDNSLRKQIDANL